MIHRDIKPHNLKLTEDGQIVLLDFGLAKGHAEGMSRMTAGHSIRGYTPNYAPLEQIQGAGTDARSDLYSLAAMLYHLMTGFTPADALSRAAAVVTGQPDPLRPSNELNPQVPQRVADVLMQAMSQNRDQRPNFEVTQAQWRVVADLPKVGRHECLVRKAQALGEAVRRGLREPLTP